MIRCLSRGLLGLALALAAALACAEAPYSFEGTPGKLPKEVRPLEYALHVVPDLAARRFRGTQTVRLEVLRPTSAIVMNALELEVEAATLTGPGLPRTRLDPPQLDAQRQTLRFALPRPLAPGRYTLTMAWRGVINETAQGLYADRYAGPGGAEKLMLATMMEPSRARRLLPCWDEPAFRARFRLTVDLPAGQAAISNMPALKREPLPGGGERIAFAATPRMPSYLLALVAGELERLEGSAEGTRLAIVTTAGKRGSAGYALGATQQLLRYYHGYFGTRYPLPKLDQIAMPGGFPGAMENWGAIVYNEAKLLVEPASSPESTRQASFGFIAHEIAHQWFGNLVTMAWWDNLWLNEGFAQWMGTKASDRFHPQWHAWLRAAEWREEALDLDARASTHPIQQPVADESGATDAFDVITYQKGSGFLRMLEHYLGEAPFRAGIRAYLARHRYSNTTTADLWAALGKASGKPVARIASDWTTQPGFPLLEVDARCEAGRRRVELRQSPFRIDGGTPDADRLWSVPVQLAEAGAAGGASTLLQARTASLQQPGCDGALLLDPDNVGFYRVRYAPALFDALVAQWPALPDGARYKLLADTSALVQADRVPLADQLGLLRRLGGEPRLALWRKALDDLEQLDRLAAVTPSSAPLQRFAVQLIAPRFTQLGWDEREGESGEDRQLRGELAQALSRYGDAQAIAEGRARFARYLAEPASLPASLVDAVLRIAGRHADAATWEALQRLAAQASTSEEKFRAYRALAEAQDPALAARTLELARDTGVPQIIRNEIAYDVARAGHLEAAWAYARENADALLADMTQYAGAWYIGGVIETSAESAHADQLEAFAAARMPEGLTLARRIADAVRSRAKLKARLLPQLEAALAAEAKALRPS